MSVKIADKLVQMNGQDYPLMDASAVEYEDSNGNKIRVKDCLDNMSGNSVIGDISTLNIQGVATIVAALNKLYATGINSFSCSKDKLTITYNNGNSLDVDLSSIVTSLGIGDLKDVDITGVTNGQVLTYDQASGNYIPKNIDTNTVLKDAKAYTDTKIQSIGSTDAIVVDAKPTYDSATGTIEYVEGGVTKTTTNTNTWFYYTDSNSNYVQTIFINGVEVTISIGSVQLADYVNKSSDVSSTYNTLDDSLIPNIAALNEVITLIDSKLSSKVNTSDIVDDLLHADSDKPLSANGGKILNEKLNNLTVNMSGSGCVAFKQQFTNVTAGDILQYQSPKELKLTININTYKVDQGTQDITNSLIDFNATTGKEFTKENIDITDSGLTTQKQFKLSSSLNSDGFYEVDLTDFKEFVYIKNEVM